MANRRTTIKLLTAGGVLASLGGGYHWLSRERHHPELTLDRVWQRLDALELDKLETTGAWEVARTFDHLAQSVEFSMEGFPESKSRFFQKSVGRLAFSVFQANGRMTHGLDEEIPGETVAADHSDPSRARLRLLSSLKRFESYEQALMPHFAYGHLSKMQYANAHVMHINNHLEEFRVG